MNTMFSALAYIIETMFVVGILGSSIVLLTSIEDFEMLSEKEPSAQGDGSQERN
jgi:hypothetical protein